MVTNVRVVDLKQKSDEQLAEFMAGWKERTGNYILCEMESKRRQSRGNEVRGWISLILSLLAVIVSVVALTACVAKRNVRVAPLFADDPYWAAVTPKSETAVVVTEGDLQRKYRPIAKIFVDSVGRDKDLSFARMKEEGAEIGADAVIQIKISTQYEGQDQNYGPRNRHTLEGLAVIYEENEQPGTSVTK